MTLRNNVVEAAARICEFNKKLTRGRLGPHGLGSYSDEKDIRNQAILVREETREYETATTMLAMLDGVIDMLVVEVWQDVLEASFHDNDASRTILGAISHTLDRYAYEPLRLRCIEPMVLLDRLNVDIYGATIAVLNDNDTKFIREVHECASTVRYYRDTMNIDCEARPVDEYQQIWGVFRLPDLKMLKPVAYKRKQDAGEGLNLLPFIPEHLRSAPLLSEDTVSGVSTIRTPANRRAPK